MKLTKVVFNRVVRLTGFGPVSEVNSSMVELRYTEHPSGVVLGDTGKAIPWHCVLEFEGSFADPLVCEDCGETFSDSRGLGSHRSRKHKGTA